MFYGRKGANLERNSNVFQCPSSVDSEHYTSEKKFNHLRYDGRFANIFLGSNFILFRWLFFISSFLINLLCIKTVVR